MTNPEIQTFLDKHGYDKIDLKAVLIDMDGVLYDSMKNHANAWYETISALGIDSTPHEFYLYEGRTGASTINLLFQRAFNRPATEKEIHEIYAKKTESFNRQPKAEAMPGAAEFLKKIKAAGLTPVLVTGSGQTSLLDKLDHEYTGIFTPETMVTAFDVKYGKPHPEPYLIGLQKAKAKPNQAIVIENAPLGVEAGVAAGIFTIGVNTGPLDDEVLLSAGANMLVSDMQTLADRFEEIYTALKQ